MKEETKALQAQVQTLRIRISDQESAEDELWDCANTIHLYAALFLKRKRGSRLSGKSRKRFYRQMFKMSAAS